MLFVAFTDVGLLDLTGAQTVFWAATKAMEARGLPGYERITASLGGGLVRSAEGLELMTMPLRDFRPSSVDTLNQVSGSDVLLAIAGDRPVDVTLVVTSDAGGTLTAHTTLTITEPDDAGACPLPKGS